MNYIVRTEDGKEFGPVNQDTLVQWAENGRITTSCKIRNILMKTWTPADQVPFLEDIVKEVVQIEVEDDDDQMMVYSLRSGGSFKYVYANPLQRFMAWLFDLALVTTFALTCFLMAHTVIDFEIVNSDTAFFLFSIFVLPTIILYYTFFMGFKAQTFGQWFWGIMIIRSNGKPVFLGRAFIFSLLSWILMPLTPISALTKRSIQDQILGVKVIKITLKGL